MIFSRYVSRAVCCLTWASMSTTTGYYTLNHLLDH